MATPQFRTPRPNQENSGIANRLLNKGGFLSERKHGSVKQAFGDVKNTENVQKQTPMKVFNKPLENLKVKTPLVKQKKNVQDEPWEKCSFKPMRPDSYYWMENCVWTDDQMDNFIKKNCEEDEPAEFVMPPLPERNISLDLLDISLPEVPELDFDMAEIDRQFHNDFDDYDFEATKMSEYKLDSFELECLDSSDLINFDD